MHPGVAIQDFIDLKGASGAEYRFRIWQDGAAHLPIAGNYVIVRAEPEGLAVLFVGAGNDLTQAQAELSKLAGRGATHIFTRLNVGRSVRAAEHADLVANYPSAVASNSGS